MSTAIPSPMWSSSSICYSLPLHSKSLFYQDTLLSVFAFRFGPPVQVDALLSPLRLSMLGHHHVDSLLTLLSFPYRAISLMDYVLLFRLRHLTLGFPLCEHLSHPAYTSICHDRLSLTTVTPSPC